MVTLVKKKIKGQKIKGSSSEGKWVFVKPQIYWIV